jgi:hypothetical protein
LNDPLYHVGAGGPGERLELEELRFDGAARIFDIDGDDERARPQGAGAVHG